MSSQNPARQSRQAYLALLALVLGGVVAYLTLPIEVTAFLLPFAIPGVICALAVGSIHSEEARKRSRMERGEGVIARWRLDGTQWQEFERLNKDVIVIPRITAERLVLPAPGVEVVFAEDAVYVDGDFYTMDRSWGTTATLSPASIELAQAGTEYHTPIRVPIPAGLYADAERVAHHFNADVGKVW